MFGHSLFQLSGHGLVWLAAVAMLMPGTIGKHCGCGEAERPSAAMLGTALQPGSPSRCPCCQGHNCKCCKASQRRGIGCCGKVPAKGRGPALDSADTCACRWTATKPVAKLRLRANESAAKQIHHVVAWSDEHLGVPYFSLSHHSDARLDRLLPATALERCTALGRLLL